MSAASSAPRRLRIAMIGQRGVPATSGGIERHVEEIGAYADGAIVGTALVRALRDGGPEAVGRLAAELAGRG